MDQGYFRVRREVGTGHSLPNDVIRIRRALNETGHSSSPPQPSGVYDANVIGSIERFQRDFGLRPDGVVSPGGPTERAIDLAIAAKREGGAAGQAMLRDAFRRFADAGLAFRPGGEGDLRDAFVTRAGDRVPPAQLASLLAHADAPAGAAAVATSDAGGDDKPMPAALRTLAGDAAASRPVAAQAGSPDQPQAKPMPAAAKARDAIEWQAIGPDVTDGTTTFKAKGPIKVEMWSPAFGFDGMRYDVDWLPLDRYGRPMPEFRRLKQPLREGGGHKPFWNDRPATKRFDPPYDHPFGFQVQIRIPPQEAAHGNSPGPQLRIFTQKGGLIK